MYRSSSPRLTVARAARIVACALPFAFALIAASASALPGIASGLPAARFMLVTTVSVPGWGGTGPAPCGTNPDYLTPVRRFELAGTGALSPLSSIPPCPATAVNDPDYVVFSSQGELFVANRHGNVAATPGSIARFKFDSVGDFVANGSISGNSLAAVSGLAINSAGELFAGNLISGRISRFRFDAMGNAVPNGTIDTSASLLHGLAFDAQGELFTTNDSPIIRRWLFDPGTGAASANGSFAIPGSRRLFFLAFSHSGEMFVPDGGTDLVYRYLFDAARNPIANGSISVAGAPSAVAFSPAGELFVTRQAGLISRFVFDGTGTAIPNGVVTTGDSVAGVAIASLVTQVEIVIKPGSFPNSINPRSNGRIPVAVVTTGGLDAAAVDPATIRFGPTGTEAAPVHSAVEDVDGDGDMDMVLHFATPHTGIECGHASATLSGTTTGGQPIAGSDTINTVGCK